MIALQLTIVNSSHKGNVPVSNSGIKKRSNMRVKCFCNVYGDSQNSKRSTIIKYPYRIINGVLVGGELNGI